MSKFKKLPEKVRREQILDAALELFSRDGYEKVSMNQLAKQAGLTKGGVYFHFSSKEEVFTAMVEAELETRASHLTKLVAESADLHPVAAIQNVLSRWLLPGDRPDLLTPSILATCIAMERPRAAFLEQNKQVTELIGQVVGPLLEELELQIDPGDLTDLLMMIRIGAIWKEATTDPAQRKPNAPPLVATTLMSVIGGLAMGRVTS